MQQPEKLVFRIFGKSPTIKIIDFLLSFPKNEFTSTEIIEDLGMSKTTFYKYFDNLLDMGMVIINPDSTRPKLHSINLENPLVHSIRNTIDFVSERIADKESLKLKVKPVEFKTMQLKHVQNRIMYLKKLERRTKTEIRKLETPIEI